MTTLPPRRHSAPTEDHEATGPAPAATFGDYMSLVKPRIIELLLVTTFPVMFLAQRGIPSPWLIAATLIGGTLSAASANILNCYLDRDIDRLMHRTENRPLVTGAISPRRALTLGILVGLASVAILGLCVNWLSAWLSLAAIFLYVGFYTVLLKRRTSQNIVWGGAAGCMPVLIGWSAVTDSLTWTPVILFLVVFFWTPPHYWPLSMRFKDDYAAAGVPMLPVVAQDLHVAHQIVIYSWATVTTSLTLIPVAPMGWIYTLTAALSGIVFLVEAHRLHSRAKNPANDSLASLKPMRLFHYSISYLTVLFIAVAIDPLVHLPLTALT
ncbi:protoheme IX farnesyltransferase [Austwickia chelonae]|uniref:Protoheme IX farnesyltransferase n=1 Tax=Austwickia chelonae NBRC 105200 TaxID=1184607 RepID=K6W5U8_9MICO|nr:heme o synthase [Austwickia chelonae]GAB77197.1 protoheme IX farnesyltransferase [Austwickia chelonae NBRC 105200]SEW04941.1 protoheme IX farnesyltransferase [Austwickia chelonae]